MKNGLEYPESIVDNDVQVLSNVFKIYSVVPEQQIKLDDHNEP